jgi:hypothetical protein
MGDGQLSIVPIVDAGINNGAPLAFSCGAALYSPSLAFDQDQLYALCSATATPAHVHTILHGAIMKSAGKPPNRAWSQKGHIRPQAVYEYVEV